MIPYLLEENDNKPDKVKQEDSKKEEKESLTQN
jgi:hypothetical protein